MKRDRALVLCEPGSCGSSGVIVRELAGMGFEITTPDEALPPPADPNAVLEMRRILAEFKARGSNSGRSVLHPGIGPWSERPELVSLSQELGLEILAPPARLLTLFRNKLSLFEEAEKCGIPNLILSSEPLHSVREVEGLVRDKIKSAPFVLKSARGGGASGVLVIQQPEELERKLPLWMEQLRRNFGEVLLFAERYLDGARHIVVPFVRFQDGRFSHFPMSDASLQSRYRKVIEFCPASALEEGTRAQIASWTEDFAARQGYVGVGALEFLVDGERAYLVEALARLNTGFPLWEKACGTSAVAWQLAASSGSRSEPGRAAEIEAGIFIRIHAEDALLQLPQPGKLSESPERTHWEFPGSQADLLGAAPANSEVPTTGRGTLGALLVSARDLKHAITIARGVLREIWFSGSVQTNERFIEELLEHPWVREGVFHAGFVDEEFLPALRPAPEILKVFAALGAWVRPAEDGGTVKWSVGDQWVKLDPEALAWVGTPERIDEGGLPGVRGRVQLSDGTRPRVSAFPTAEGQWLIRLGSWFYQVKRATVGGPLRRRRKILSLVPGRVHSVLYREGTLVPAHEPLLIIESMGILVPHALPLEATISQWNVSAEDFVRSHQELAELELPPKQ
ncbi:MAG: ATP-binding protein [Bdellovibrionota bacterium]